MTPTLPEGFEDFEPFLEWALPTQGERSAKKMSSSFDDLVALYDLGMQNNRLAAALGHCDQYALDQMPEDVLRLFLITMSMAEVRPQVELYGEVHPTHLVSAAKLPMKPECDVL